MSETILTHDFLVALDAQTPPDKYRWYQDVAELAVIFHHDVVRDHRNKLRWKRNRLMRLLSVDFNQMWPNVVEHFSIEEMVKFYMQVGYDLIGFCEVFRGRAAIEIGLPGATPINEETGEHQDIIDWLVLTHKGKVLKL